MTSTLFSPFPGTQGRLPCPYLYMVSASTSPNHTLSPEWKFSPWSSSVATSPPPLSWERGGTSWCGGRGGQGPATLPPLHPTPSAVSPPGSSRAPIHLEGADEGHRSDWLPGTRQAGAEGEFHRFRANNGPARAVVEQRSIRLLGAGGGLGGDPRDRQKLRMVATSVGEPSTACLWIPAPGFAVYLPFELGQAPSVLSELNQFSGSWLQKAYVVKILEFYF